MFNLFEFQKYFGHVTRFTDRRCWFEINGHTILLSYDPTNYSVTVIGPEETLFIGEVGSDLVMDVSSKKTLTSSGSHFLSIAKEGVLGVTSWGHSEELESRLGFVPEDPLSIVFGFVFGDRITQPKTATKPRLFDPIVSKRHASGI